MDKKELNQTNFSKRQRERIQTSRILKVMNIIEDKTDKMIHEIPELKDVQERYYRGDTSGHFLLSELNKYLDKLNMD